MPLSTDEKTLALSQAVLKQFDTIFGDHPGFRPAHAKGIMLTGTFTPSPESASLSKAPHLNRPSTPVTVRFSNSSGIPAIPDNDPNAAPRGCAIRFNLAEHVHTDIVSHSTNHFPARTGEEFLEFLKAIAASDPAHLSGSPLEKFLGSHPAALAFVQAPKPAPSSFARETYFGLTAMRFINQDGKSRYGRYRIVPEDGNQYLSPADAATKDANYLFNEITERISRQAVAFRIVVQLAEDKDQVDDATVHWPDDRPIFEPGKLVLKELVADNSRAQKQIIFDPIPRVDGIEPSKDPLLDIRANVYLLSGRRRRTAPE
jgi:catalase